jgi:hypothetical protein
METTLASWVNAALMRRVTAQVVNAIATLVEI